MRGGWLVVGLAIAGALGSSRPLVSRQPARTLVLDHARVVDGTGRPPRNDMRVVVRGDRIEAVGPAATVALQLTPSASDLSGRVVMPGLIDLHFHIERDPKLALRQLANG